MHQYANGPWEKKAHQYSSVPRQSLGQLKAPDSSEEDSFTLLHTLLSATGNGPPTTASYRKPRWRLLKQACTRAGVT